MRNRSCFTYVHYFLIETFKILNDLIHTQHMLPCFSLRPFNLFHSRHLCSYCGSSVWNATLCFSAWWIPLFLIPVTPFSPCLHLSTHFYFHNGASHKLDSSLSFASFLLKCRRPVEAIKSKVEVHFDLFRAVCPTLGLTSAKNPTTIFLGWMAGTFSYVC